LIDKPENESKYTVDVLTEMKIAHESSISKRLEVQKYFNIKKVKGKIAICLAENREVWLRYGPISDIAQKNPNSEEIYAIWTSERLSTIVPNNRIIVSILEANRGLFDRQDQTIISEFLSHAKSYEKWVRDEIPYHAVIRFPTSFEHLIMGS
jgi:predicted signal transduction protein with EAL and GGDEF domain